MVAQHIGRYEIKSELGRGGMATVYEAYDPRFRREVAIKVLPSQFLHDATFRARFEREAQAIAAIEHPAIVPVYDFGEEDDQPFLVMRFMGGGSLSDRLKKGPISLTETARIFSRLAPGLDEMHSHGIIHRDLKPGNILFDQYGNAYISDFGIARMSEATTALTGDNIIGTPSYMSPEQARGDPNIDGRSDIYALGAILFEMLTGHTPYEAQTPLAIAMKHIIEPVPSILEVKADLPADSDTLISKAMAKDPNDRYATATELEEAVELLAGFKGGISPVKPVTVHPAVPPGPTVADTPINKPIQVETRPQVEPKPPIPQPPRPVTPGPSVQEQRVQTPIQHPVQLPVQPAVAVPAPVKKGQRLPAMIMVPGVILGVIALCGIVLLMGVGGSRLLSGWMGAVTPSAATTAPPPVISESAPQILGEKTQPAATPTYRYLDKFTDDFSNPDSGWERSRLPEGITDYDLGSYKILVDRPNMIFYSVPHVYFKDVAVEVEATKTSGPDENSFGIICRYQDEKNFYFMVVASDGYYLIGKWKNGQASSIGMDGFKYSEYVHRGMTSNIVRGECKDNTLTLYANETRLDSVEDNDFTAGDIGLMAMSFNDAGVSILFDNLTASLP